MNFGENCSRWKLLIELSMTIVLCGKYLMNLAGNCPKCKLPIDIWTKIALGGNYSMDLREIPFAKKKKKRFFQKMCYFLA